YTEYEYTGRDLTKFTDEAGTETVFEYCATCGQMTEMHEPLSRSLFWQLDGDHDLTQFTDARSNNTTYQIGLASERKRMTLADNTYRDYKYDNFGRLSKLLHWQTTPTGTFSYNSAGRVSGLSFGSNNAANS